MVTKKKVIKKLTKKVTKKKSKTTLAEILPVGRGRHALPFLCKACHGIATA
jgi:hypothetical protein